MIARLAGAPSVASAAPTAAEPDAIRRAAAEVLARAEFSTAQPPLQRALGWLSDLLARGIALLGGDGRGLIIGIVILVAALAATIALGIVLVRRVRRDPSGAARRSGAFAGRSSDDWMARAREREAAHDWPAALRCRYRALLADLVEAQVIDEVAGRTARDYERAIAGAASGVDAQLAWVTDTFEAAWYDRRPVTADDVAHMDRASAAVRRAVRTS